MNFKELHRGALKRFVITQIEQGKTLSGAAGGAGVARSTIYRWRASDNEFDQEYAAAWEEAKERRDRLCYLAHPFLGKRPPISKYNGGFPRYPRGR